jgi:hypothetical protein
MANCGCSTKSNSFHPATKKLDFGVAWRHSLLMLEELAPTGSLLFMFADSPNDKCYPPMRAASKLQGKAAQKGSECMYEIFAICAGVLLGWTAQRTANIRLKVAMLVLGSVIIGAIVSIISGELLVS